jgi:hypothetical protein
MLRQVSVVAIFTGVAIAFTVWSSNFSDFMLLEDLGLEDSEVASALRKVSPGERLILNSGLFLAIIGSVLLLLASIRRFKQKTHPQNIG